MSKQKPKRKKRVTSPAPITLTQAPTPQQAMPETVNLSFNALSLHAENMSELQVVAMLPPSMQERAFDLAKSEQEFRHRITECNFERDHAAKMDAQEKNFILQKRHQRGIFWGDIAGKFSALILSLAALFALWCYLSAGSALPSEMWKYVLFGVAVICSYFLGKKKRSSTK